MDIVPLLERLEKGGLDTSSTVGVVVFEILDNDVLIPQTEFVGKICKVRPESLRRISSSSDFTEYDECFDLFLVHEYPDPDRYSIIRLDRNSHVAITRYGFEIRSGSVCWVISQNMLEPGLFTDRFLTGVIISNLKKNKKGP
jgi:hypothetical protein